MHCANLENLHNCPYCNSSSLYIDECSTCGRNGCCVACSDCGMSGPVSFEGEELAVRGWEVLCSKMCRHCVVRLVDNNKKLRAELRKLGGEE